MKLRDYGDRCYNSTGSRCSGKAQPGTVALRQAVVALWPILGTLGIYNCRPSSGGGGLSTHGEGRGWDCRCNALDSAQLTVGNHLATLLIKYHQALGIQRIIWNRRQWDVLTKTWRAYGGQSPHTDHLHIELCWASARDNPLTVEYVKMVLGAEEDDLPYTEAELKAIFRDVISEELGKKEKGAFKNLYLWLTYKARNGLYRQGIDDIVNATNADPTTDG